jgi:hypothetical protein
MLQLKLLKLQWNGYIYIYKYIIIIIYIVILSFFFRYGLSPLKVYKFTDKGLMKCTTDEKFLSLVIFIFPFSVIQNLRWGKALCENIFRKSRKFESFVLFLVVSKFFGLES